MKKVLITGASGLLGRAVMREFEANGSWTILGLAFSRAGQKLKKVDLTNPQAVTEVLQEFKPSVVIHCAAERRPDVVEKQEEATYSLNVQATKSLCQSAAAVDASVIYISTDYVFDGKNPPFKVTDPPNPLNKYGKSKLEGEKVCLAEGKANAVLRVPILYGEVEQLDESAVTVLFTKVKNPSVECVMSDYERRYPTHCDDIAVGEDISGIFHWSGDEMMTKYDMAVAMAEAFGIPKGHIKADKNPSGGAPRPYDAHLDSSRVESLGICKRSKFKDRIRPALERFYP
ncbi:hypothetical protein BaRGS_00013463 [Batillaria attramentaria]|uniref:Methionine adenosyltransferase 2 subunit beta n=1 Tax=Batillaria attramentaria TaxID=370345 RepID=A0ABD0L6W2_9CAEN